jgi:hypothetical protein
MGFLNAAHSLNKRKIQIMKRSFFSKFLLPFIAFAVVMASMATNVSAVVGINPTAVFTLGTATVVAVHLYARPHTFANVAHLGIPVEVWVNYIQEKLFKVNPFLQHCTSHDDKVLGGKIVHLPQAGGPSAVVKNRNVFPAVAIRRTDTDISYILDVYTTDPVHIELSDTQEISYDKIDSVVGQDVQELIEVVADDILIKWLGNSLPQANILLTDGAATSDYTLPGASGARKLFTEEDLRRGMRAIRNQNKRGKVYFQPTVDMHDQLVKSLSQTQYADFSRAYDEKTGVIGTLHGATILEPRAGVAIMDGGAGTLAPLALGAALSADSNDTSILFTEDAVARAMGDAYIFDDNGNPLYYGDVFSTLLRMGGRRTRNDNKGILAITQAPTA